MQYRAILHRKLFDREAIPESLPYRYKEESDVDANFEDDIDMLRSYCLIGMSGGDDMFEMHWLVQFSMKKWLEQHGGASRMARTVR